jgi:ribosome maturation factor RimP
MGKCAHFLFVAPACALLTPAVKMTDLAELIETTVTGLGYELVDVERSNRSKLLRVFIDLLPQQAAQAAAAKPGKKKPGAMISVEDCEKVSRQLTYAFTVEDLDYDRLEVSSPGLDRPLKKPADFERFAGQEANIKLRKALGGEFGIRKNFQGIVRYEDGKALLEVEGQMVEIDFTQVDKARLVPKYEF